MNLPKITLVKALILCIFCGIIIVMFFAFSKQKTNNNYNIMFKKNDYNKVDTKYYLYRNQEYFYDLTSFKYNFILEKFTIDVVIDTYSFEKENAIKSPFDKNYISYLIFETNYSKKAKKIKTKYKGFISGDWDIGTNHKTFKEAKIYYKVYKFKNLDLYEKDLENCLKRISFDGTTYYEQNLNEILNAKRNGALTEMNGIFTSVNRSVDN